jgi:iron(III) transport system permease protein
VSNLPVSVPGMLLGLAYIFAFNAPGSVLNALYGTLAMLIVSNVIHYFTVGFLTATAALKQMDGEFESVSASLGVPFYRATPLFFLTIYAPPAY